MVVERYLTLKVQLWRKVYFNAKRAWIVALVVLIVFSISQVPVFFNEIPTRLANSSSNIRDRYVQGNIAVAYLQVREKYLSVNWMPFSLTFSFVLR